VQPPFPVIVWIEAAHTRASLAGIFITSCHEKARNRFVEKERSNENPFRMPSMAASHGHP
jgi:hypothetical protein